MIVHAHRSRHLSLSSWVCEQEHSNRDAPELATAHELIFVRRGVFAVSGAGAEILLTPNEALLLHPGVLYTARHPVAGGDECTVVGIAAELATSLRHTFGRGPSPRAVPVDATLFRAQSSLLRAATERQASPLEVEERLSRIVTTAAASAGQPPERGEESAPVRRRVASARELIAAHFQEPLPLATIGDMVGLSPFHLARAFRRITGTSMHRYQTQLRVRAAMARLTQGENDLTGLALDLGFSSHTHFTTSFGREFGVAPAAFRRGCRGVQT